MKGTIKENGVSEVHNSLGQVHVHVEGTFGGGTATLEYSNEYGSKALIANQDETNYAGRFSGGADYAASDTITLTDGSVITVDAVTSGGAAPPYEDTFTRADGALTTPWTQLGDPSVVIDTNVAKIDPGSFAVINMTDMGFTGPMSSVAVEFDVTERDVSDSAFVVHFHHDGVNADASGRGIAVELYFDGSGVYTQIFNQEALDQGYSVAYPVTLPETFRIELTGDTLTFSKGGVQFATRTIADTMPTATSVFGFEGQVGFIKVDNFKFYDLTAVNPEAGAAGEVTEFTVTASGAEFDLETGKTYAASSTSGSGSGFALTTASENLEQEWRAIAGEAYTAAADRFLALPNGTRVRLVLTGATDPDIFYEVR